MKGNTLKLRAQHSGLILPLQGAGAPTLEQASLARPGHGREEHVLYGQESWGDPGPPQIQSSGAKLF